MGASAAARDDVRERRAPDAPNPASPNPAPPMFDENPPPPMFDENPPPNIAWKKSLMPPKSPILMWTF